MSNIRVNAITDEAGTGAPDFPNGYTVAGAVPAAPESGTQTFTATGALANGDLVGLNPDGTVSVMSPYSLQTTNANAVASTWVTSTFDTLNNKVVTFYVDTATGYFYSVVGTISGSTISFGTPVVVLSSNSGYSSCTFDTLNNKVVVAVWDGTAAIAKAFVGTVSGTTISFGAVSTISSGGQWPVLTFDSINNKVVVLYKMSASPYQVYSKVGTVSGTTISFGTQATAGGFATNAPTNITFSAATGKVVGLYVDVTTTLPNLVVGTVSGTTISYGTPVALPNCNDSYASIAYDNTTGSVVATCSTAVGYVFLVCTISGTSISFGIASAPISFGGYVSYPKLIGVGNGTFVYAAYRSGFFYKVIIKTDGVLATPVLASKVEGYGSQIQLGLAFDPVNKLAVVSYRGPNPFYLTSDLVNPFSPTLTWVGVAAEAIANGASGKVTTTGGINSGQTGLTTGAPYGYNTDTGAFIVGGDNLGYAISPTQLYIK
jgi:hypothetical protein